MEFKAFQILAAEEGRHFHFKPGGTEIENDMIRDWGLESTCGNKNHSGPV